MKHTKGKWTAVQPEIDGIKEPCYWKISSDVKGEHTYNKDNQFATITGFDITGYMNPADAQLIASAPNLLEALKDAINFIILGLNDKPIDVDRFLKMKKAVINAEK